MSFLSKFQNVKSRVVALLPLIALTVFSPWALAQSGPAQMPLLSRDGGTAKPNIMLNMDDSGSMSWSHMPENTIYAGAYEVESPVKSRGVRMDPGEDSNSYVNYIGTVAAERGSGNYRQKLLRSPDTNTIYYNPEVRYLPWMLADGSGGRMSNSPPAAAYRDPMNPSGTKIDLTDVRDLYSRWCYYPGGGNDCDRRTENYDPGLYYRLKKDGAGNYKDPEVASNYDEFSVNRDTSFFKYPARTDCAGTTCTQAEERQNFANWFTYYRTRNLLARGSLGEAFADGEDTFRIGWGRINKRDESTIDGVKTTVIEAGVRDFTLDTKKNLLSWIYALPADGGTPLRSAMQKVGEYYKREDVQGPWTDNPGQSNDTSTNKTCRRAYHIMVTDGYWSSETIGVGNSDNTAGPEYTYQGRVAQYNPTAPFKDDTSDTLADVAMEYWKKDLAPNVKDLIPPTSDNPAFWQHMVNFTVGLGVRGVLNPETDLPALTEEEKVWGADKSNDSWKIDDLWHAAVNSRGAYLSAKDPNELAKAIRSAVSQALMRELREAGVATASTVLQEGNRKYVPLYKSVDWNGDIEAYALDALGQAGAQVWNAASKLPAPGSRNIYTWRNDTSPPSGATFTWTAMGADNQTALGTVGATHTTDFVNFLRGDRSKEGDGQPFRTRTDALGDFVNSNPVLVRDGVNLGYVNLPTAQGGGAAYSTFLTQKAARDAVLFVGGNDGMLHAFKDTLGRVQADDGKEIFAYVPRAVYPNLPKLADKDYGTPALYHQYFVDGPLVETDVYVPAPGDTGPTWRNYLLGALGAGGRAVFALDVTNSSSMNASNIRWEISDQTYPDLGYITAPLQAGVLPNGEWVAVFGNGRFSANGNAVLFVVNLSTRVVQTLTVDGTGANGLSGVGLVRNSSGQIAALYAGDLKGNLWKFEYSASEASRFAVSGGTPMFVATDDVGTLQPITQAPIVFNSSRGGRMVLFGTGRLDTETDANDTSIQSVFSIWDQDADAISRPMARSVLEPRVMTPVETDAGTFYAVTGQTVNWSSQRGWVLDLTGMSGLRVIYPPQTVTSKVALVSSVSPARKAGVCEASTGSGVNFLFNVENGANPASPMYDTNGDDVVDSSDAAVVGYTTNSDGIDAVVKGGLGGGTDAAGQKCPAGTRLVSLQNTTGQMLSCVPDDDPAAIRSIKDRVWRRIINPPIR